MAVYEWHTDPDPTHGEAAIIWLDDLREHDYVRQITVDLATRDDRPVWRGPGRLVGYTTIRPNVRPSRPAYTFRRRLFWLWESDRGEPLGASGPFATYGVPYEGVDPRTVAPGRGKTTDRAGGDVGPTRDDRELRSSLRQPKSRASVIFLAKCSGITRPRLYASAKRLGVLTTGRGEDALWSLPDAAPPTTTSANAKE